MKIRLYGDLKEKSEKCDEFSDSIGVLDIDLDGIEAVIDLLEHLEIKKSEISHVFVNREYSAIGREISEDDRVALFPKDMGLLYKWYFKKEK